MRKYRIIAVGGIVSPVTYTLMWILGGLLVPGYSHITNDVSSLMAVDAPLRWLFQSMAIVCSTLLFAFYTILHRVAPGNSRTGPALYVSSAFLGLLVALFFPLDANGELITWRAISHLVLIALAGVLLIAGMVFMARRLKPFDEWRSYRRLQLVMAPILLLCVVVMAPFAGSPYMGLVERFMVSAYQVFYALSGWIILRHLSKN